MRYLYFRLLHWIDLMVGHPVYALCEYTTWLFEQLPQHLQDRENTWWDVQGKYRFGGYEDGE